MDSLKDVRCPFCGRLLFKTRAFYDFGKQTANTEILCKCKRVIKITIK